MGIPRLTSLLRPYAELESLKGQDAVLDGPAFCYHIYYTCLKARKSARNALEAAISYEELGTVSIAWLDALRSNGISIRQIYFDGFLPTLKFNTRIDRLISQTKQLLAYHITYPETPCRAPAPVSENGINELFSHGHTRESLTKLPPLPFLVPAILEALLVSDNYKDITAVVPSEADGYCAMSLKNCGGIVLTGDSDLLIHDIGLRGAVIFFRDIDLNADETPSTLRSPVYRPAVIIERIGLSTPSELLALAFEMRADTYSSLNRLLAQTKSSRASQINLSEYEDFKKEYDCVVAQPSVETKDRELVKALQGLDPRISEYVLQYPFIAEVAGQRLDNPSFDVSPHIFLPFLWDCPVRTNAWEMSRATRQLAYGLMNLIAPKGQPKASVFEHKRQEAKSGGRELQLPETASIADACLEVVALIEQLSTKLPNLSKVELWIAIAVYQETEWSHQNSKNSLGEVVKKQVMLLADQFHKSLSWDILHYLAQIQGSYHSFRMLKQIINLLVSKKKTLLPLSIVQLHEHLRTLPALSTIPDLSRGIEMILMIKNTDMSKAAHEILGIAIPNVGVSKVSRREAKRKRKADRAGNLPSQESKRPSNLFKLLEDE